MRVDAGDFRELDLEVHDFLGGVPLHDVWVARLRGGVERPDLRDVMDLFVTVEQNALAPPVRGLFAVREWLGQRFGWDAEPEGAAAGSYVERLPTALRARSLEPPGSRRAFWRVVYTLEHEAVGEVVNRTVHAFLCFALRPAPGGHRLYWAVYVKPVSPLTPVYMALIDPFRRWLVYPEMIRRLEAQWARAAGSTP